MRPFTLAVTLALVMALALGLPAVAAAEPVAARARPVEVVASFGALAEAAERVGGPGVRVTDLTPPGVEPHDLELTTDDVDRILDADLVVVMGDGFQPAVEATADDRDGPTLVVLDEVARRRRHDDPHVWLDPLRYRTVVDRIARALRRLDPSHAREHRARADRFGARLTALDAAFVRGLERCASRTFVTSHDAFGWLAARYHLHQLGAAGTDPEGEPTPDRIAELADIARREHATTIFTEPLVSARVARTVARAAGDLRTAVLDPFEHRDPEARGGRGDYLRVMERNLAALRRALRCP